MTSRSYQGTGCRCFSLVAGYQKSGKTSFTVVDLKRVSNDFIVHRPSFSAREIS